MITTLAELVAMVESGNNPMAVRFEPAHNPAQQYVYVMAAVCKCTFLTAKTLCAMSWGKYQIMGDNLMSLGLSMTPMEFCFNNNAQDEFFERFIGQDHISLTLQDVLAKKSARYLFARLYNGPGAPDMYVQRMESVARADGLEVTA